MWKITKEELEFVIKNSLSFKEAIIKLGIDYVGSSPTTLKKVLSYHNIDYSVISNSKIPGKKQEKIELSRILTENSNYNRTNLKTRLLKEGLLENKCSVCGLGEIWNCKKINHQIDHINGIRNDNRISNLRMVCPNCHSQTETFAGKRLKKNFPAPDGWRVRDRVDSRKVNRPTRDVLCKLMSEHPMTHIGKMFGVSDNAVRKWAKRYRIIGTSSSGKTNHSE